jgi:hypothetical protein
MKIKKHILSTIALVTLMSGIAAAAIPGPQRALVPTFYGLTEIAPDVFTDDPSQKSKWMDMREVANARVHNFFGTLKANPRYILCSKMTCEHIFGKNGNIAQSYGWSIIHIPPKALEGRAVGITLLAHERVHAELLYRWGALAIWDQKIPNWFNEGLATFVAKDPRIDPFYSAEERHWIRGSKTFWDWGNFVESRGWRTAYGAAAYNVVVLQKQIGNDGLLKLIDRAIKGEGFEKVAKEMAPNAL